MKKILLLVLPLITFSFVFAECDLAFMQPGYQGSKVIALQKYLQTNGYYTATLSARYDTATVSAVKKLQAKNALLATGLIDQKTQLLLASTLCANSQAVKVEEVDLNSTATPLLSALENQAFSLPNGLEFTSVGREKAFLAKGVVLKPLPNFISGEFSYMVAIASTSLTKENPEKPWPTQTPYDSFVFYGSSTIPVYSDVDIMVNKVPVYTTFTQESINKNFFRYVVFGSKKFGPYNSVTSLTNIDEHLYFLATLEDGLYLFDEKGQKIAGPFVRNPILFSKILSYQGKPLFNSEKKVKPYIISDESFSDVPAQPIQTVDFFSKIKKLFLFSSNVKQKKSSISIGSESEWKLTLGTQIVASSSSPIIYFFVDQATGKIAYKREYYVGGTTCSGIMSENKWIVKGCMEEQVASFYGISNGVVAYSNLSSPIVTNDKIQPTSLKPNSEESIAYFFAHGKLFERLGSSMPKDLLYDGVSITDELSKQGLSLSQYEGFPMARDAYSVINDRLVLRVFDKGGHVYFLMQK